MMTFPSNMHKNRQLTEYFEDASWSDKGKQVRSYREKGSKKREYKELQLGLIEYEEVKSEGDGGG